MVTNNIIVFQNNEFGEVRTLIIDDCPYFVGKDIATVLGYSNASKAVSCHVDEDDKRFVMLDIADSQNGNVPHGQSKPAIINESGLYSLILSSKLPAAKEFKHWVTSEVLPAIRKNGTYSVQKKPDSYTIDDPIERAKRWIEEYEEKKALEHKIEQDKPLVDFANHVSDTSDLIDIGTLAKLARDEHINIGRTRLFDWLRSSGYLMNSGKNKNQPYQKYIEQGLFKVREYTFSTPYGNKVGTQTLVTGKGQMYFIEKFRKSFPTI